jgi:hypothetical protein
METGDASRLRYSDRVARVPGGAISVNARGFARHSREVDMTGTIPFLRWLSGWLRGPARPASTLKRRGGGIHIVGRCPRWSAHYQPRPGGDEPGRPIPCRDAVTTRRCT